MSRSVFTTKLGGEIRETRLTLKLSQAEVAEAIGVSASSVSGWEHGLTIISAYSHAKLKKFFKAEAKAQQIANKPSSTHLGVSA